MRKKTFRLKRGVRLSRHEPLKTLTDEKLVAQAFWECLRDNDPEGAAEIIAIHVSALNKVQLAKEEGILAGISSGARLQRARRLRDRRARISHQETDVLGGQVQGLLR